MLCQQRPCEILYLRPLALSALLTQCARTRSLNLFFTTVVDPNPPVLGLLGCGCSVASEPVAEIIHHWNISQVCMHDIVVPVLDQVHVHRWSWVYVCSWSFILIIINEGYRYCCQFFVVNMFIGSLQLDCSFAQQQREVCESLPYLTFRCYFRPGYHFTSTVLRLESNVGSNGGSKFVH